jgi:hypothetical protein
MGLFNDVFGCDEHTLDSFWSWVEKGYTDGNTGELHPGMTGFWKYAPSGGEFDYSLRGDCFSGANFRSTMNQLEKTHISWLGPSVPVYSELPAEEKNNMNSFLKKIGYRFNITKSEYVENVAEDGIVQGKITLVNEGVAPFYFKWPLVLRIKDAEGKQVDSFTVHEDIRSLLPGKHVITYTHAVLKEVPAGKYDLMLSVDNPETGKPEIEFANKGMTGKQYKIGQISVESGIPKSRGLVLQIGSHVMELDGVRKDITPDKNVVPVLLKGRTYIPAEAVIEAMGGTFDWDSQRGIITLSRNESIVRLWVGKGQMRVNNGSKVRIDSVPEIINGTVMVPLRAINEPLGFDVVWDGYGRKVTIKYHAGQN